MDDSMKEKLFTILLVEDNPDDVELTRESLKMIKMATNLEVVMNGGDALEFLKGEGFTHRSRHRTWSSWI